MKKRFLAMVLTMLMLFCLLPTGVMAEEASVSYQLLTENEDYAVYTKSDYPWTESNGTYTSGNKGAAKGTFSNLKITFKKAGVVSFDWSVSYTKNKALFSYRMNTDFVSASDAYQGTYTSGDEQGVASRLEVAAEESLYLTYLKVSVDTSAATSLTDTATVSNIKLSPKVEGGESTVEDPIVFDESMGSVTADRMEKKFNDNGTYYFALSSAALEDVQVGETYRLKATANTGYRFYGWVKEYTYNGVAYKEFMPMQYYTLGTGTADNGATVNKQVRVTNPELEVTFDGTSAYRAVFAPTGSYVLRVNADFYESGADLANIINNAVANDVIEILSDISLTGNATLPKGALLYVPFRSGWSEDDAAGKYRAGGYKNYNATAAINDTDHYVTLTVNNGVTLNVNGKLAVGSVVGYNSQRFQGHISGAHGRIINNGTIAVNSGGLMTCYGPVDGSGTVRIDDDASLKEMFIIGDFAGGNNSAQLYFTSQMPFKRFSVQNVRCKLQMEAKAQLIAMAHVWASSMYNEAEVVLFGNHDKAAFRPNGGLSDTVVLTRTYNSNQALTDGNGLLDVSGIGRTEWTFSDGLTFQPLVVGLGPIELDTSQSDFTIPYNFKITLVKGTYDLNVGMRVMPGAEVTVASGATVYVGGRLMVLDGLVQTDMSGDRYPNRSELTAGNKFSGSGELTVNGTLIMKAGSSLGGLVKSDSDGMLVVEDGVYLSNSGTLSNLDQSKELINQSYDLYTGEGGVYVTSGGESRVVNWVQQDGAVGYYDENTTWFNLPARICTEDGIQQVQVGKTYNATAGNGTAEYSAEYLYVEDDVYGKISNGEYGYLTENGIRKMTAATENLSRSVNAVWVDSEQSDETVTVEEPTVAGISTATVSYAAEKSGADTLLKELQVVDEETGTAKTEKYVFLVKYTVEGSTTGITVTANDDGSYPIPPEANGVTIEACLKGDMNGNGALDGRDVANLKKATVGSFDLSELATIAADLNGNGALDGRDVANLKKATVGSYTIT